eukprot:6272255-Amphidinium_carterae.1
MLGIATLAALQAYERNFERLARSWSSCWHLLVQADDKRAFGAAEEEIGAGRSVRQTSSRGLG